MKKKLKANAYYMGSILLGVGVLVCASGIEHSEGWAMFGWLAAALVLGGVALGLDVVKGLADGTRLIDQEGGTYDSQAFLALTLTFLPDAVGLADLTLEIRQQPDIDAMLIPKGPMADAAIHADTDNLGLQGLEFRLQISELQGLQGAARGIVPGVEVEHQVFPTFQIF